MVNSGLVGVSVQMFPASVELDGKEAGEKTRNQDEQVEEKQKSLIT
jgi:hypothetical protein